MALNVPRIVPLKRSSLADEIVTQLQRLILRGDLPADHRLPSERELAQVFNVNRGTVREALQRLQSLDLVAIRHGDGIYVQNYLHSTNLDLLRAMLEPGGPFKPGVVRSLLEIRRLLVPEMTYLAAKTRTTEDLEALARVVGDATGMSVLERDIAVHRVIASASRNLPYLLLLNFLNDATRDLAEAFFDDEHTRGETEQIHRDLYEAIKARRAEAAKQIMVEALAGAERRTLRILGKQTDGRPSRSTT